MATKKSQPKKTNPKSPINPIKVLKENSCQSLHYKIGIDEAGAIQLKIAKNSGGGFFSNEWVVFTAIQDAFNDWPEDTPITSMALRPIFRGKSVNTPGFMIKVLTAEKLLEPMANRKRVHQACDPAVFLAAVEELKKGAGIKTGKNAPAKAKPKPKVKAKAKPAEKSKTANRASAKTAKTPREKK